MISKADLANFVSNQFPFSQFRESFVGEELNLHLMENDTYSIQRFG